MLQVRDPKVISIIERLSEHYRMNIANRYIRPALLQLPIDKLSWDLIEIFTEKVDQFRFQGFMLDELYRQIAAMARFIALVRRELIPGLRNRISGGAASGPDKVMRDMAVNNFSSNLKVLADLLYELYINLVELDKANARGHQPLYAQMAELSSIGSLLVGG